MFSALYAIARPSHGWISEKRLKLDYAISTIRTRYVAPSF